MLHFKIIVIWILELAVLFSTFGFYLECDHGYSWTLYILWGFVRFLSGLWDLIIFFTMAKNVGCVERGKGFFKFLFYRIVEELLHFDRLTDFQVVNLYYVQ